MKIYVAVMMFGGLIEEVKAFAKKDAVERYRTAKNTEFKELVDFEGVQLFDVNLVVE